MEPAPVIGGTGLLPSLTQAYEKDMFDHEGLCKMVEWARYD